MAVRKPCRSRGCKSSPRCEHPWWLDVMHNRERYRMPVDDFALARGATAPVTSKQEAEKVWEPKFIAEIVSGKDPRVPIERETTFERPTTVADLPKVADGLREAGFSQADVENVMGGNWLRVLRVSLPG